MIGFNIPIYMDESINCIKKVIEKENSMTSYILGIITGIILMCILSASRD